MPEVSPICLFRIPLTISVGSTVLAFAEGRPGLAQSVNPCGDGSGRSIWMRRSENAGRSWDAEPTPIVNDTDAWHDALHDGVVLGAAVFERSTKTVFLFYTTCYHKCWPTGPTTLFVKSESMGLHWSKPTNLTSLFLKEKIFMMQWGEGLGVQWPATNPHYPSRLLVCGWYNDQPKYGFAGVVCLGSDDAGAAWHVQGKLAGPVNEVGLALLQNGSLLLNMRSAAMHRNRVQSMSKTGGATFTALRDVLALPDPVCNGGVTALPGGTVVLTHDALAAGSTNRTRANMSIFTSSSGGDSWDAGHVLWAGPAAYSTVTPLGGSNVGVLYERGFKQDIENITFASVDTASSASAAASAMVQSKSRFRVLWNSNWPHGCKDGGGPPIDFAKDGIEANAKAAFVSAATLFAFLESLFWKISDKLFDRTARWSPLSTAGQAQHSLTTGADCCHGRRAIRRTTSA